MIDFGEIVIFAGQPEDGRMRTPRRRRLPRARDRRGRLEWSKQRPAEQAHLLPGHHHARALPQCLNAPAAALAEGFCAASSSTSSGQCAGTCGPALPILRRTTAA